MGIIFEGQMPYNEGIQFEEDNEGFVGKINAGGRQLNTVAFQINKSVFMRLDTVRFPNTFRKQFTNLKGTLSLAGMFGGAAQ